MFDVRLSFDPGLLPLLHRPDRAQPVLRRLTEKTAIKDIIESCGVPHPEVDLIVVNGRPVGFGEQLLADASVTVLSVGASPSVHPDHRLQERRAVRFVADCHLGKLARNLRLLGLDVAYSASADDEALLTLMQEEERALLTGDRPLLMHNVVRTGYCPRSDIAEEQTREIVRRFRLSSDDLRPYSRCARCNGLLEDASKADVEGGLPPLTRRYYHTFRRCTSCGHVYWSGAHAAQLEAFLRRVNAES